MKHMGTCDICQQKARGKRYDFYYGLFLGNTDVYIGGPGTVGNRWTEHYSILGQSGSFICEKCISREFWKRVFSEPRLKELEVRWFDLFELFLGIGIGFALLAGVVKLTEHIGLPITISESFGPTFAFLYFVVVTAVVLLIMKITTYMLDFGNEMAYRIKYKELPKIPKLICIPPSKYALFKQPSTTQQEKPKTTERNAIQYALFKQPNTTPQEKPKTTERNAIQEEAPRIKKGQSVQKTVGITDCPNCKMKVLPKSDGTCPSCQSKIM